MHPYRRFARNQSEHSAQATMCVSRRHILTGPAALSLTTLAGCTSLLVDSNHARHGQPELAALHGFNRLALFDDFSSLDTIDLHATGKSGYLWYPQGFMPGRTTPASAFSVSESVLTIAFDKPPNAHLWTVGYLGPQAPRYVGTLFEAGGYFEARMAFDPALAAGQRTWPCFWMDDIEGILADVDKTPTRFGELDFFEAFPHDKGKVDPLFSVHEWDKGAKTDIQNANYIAELGGVDFREMHTYATLWLPMARNRGTGLIQRYFDGRHLEALDVVYSASAPALNGAIPANPSGLFSILDDGRFTVALGTGLHWPAHYDDVQVWQ